MRRAVLRWRVLPALVLTAAAACAAAAQALLDFSAEERERILAHGPWPPPPLRDPSNRVDGQRAAIEFGAPAVLRPAPVGRRPTSPAPAATSRRGPSRTGGRWPRGGPRASATRRRLLDAAQRRWFGWDGAHDSLWAASLSPLLQADEMGATPARPWPRPCAASRELGRRLPRGLRRGARCRRRTRRRRRGQGAGRLAGDPGVAAHALRRLPRRAGARRRSRRGALLRWPRSAGCACSSARRAAASAMPARRSATANSPTSACPSSCPAASTPAATAGCSKLLAEPHEPARAATTMPAPPTRAPWPRAT